METTKQSKLSSGALGGDIQARVQETLLVDTHEHIWEERLRVKGAAGPSHLPAPDFGLLMMHYTDSDLQVSGMPAADFQRLLAYGVEPLEKWRLVAPYYARCRNTGYQMCVRETIRALYGEEDIREDNCERISQRVAAAIQPGFYRHLLRDVAKIEYAQVNSLETPVFMETAQPDLLCQDISTVALSTGLDIAGVCKVANREAADLKQWHGVIDWCFETYGPRAIAVKNQSAYNRRLNYDRVSEEEAAPLFARYVKEPHGLSAAELKALQDHLFHYCVEKATEYKLPVKLHTGYYAGHNGMPLERLRQNAGDLCPVLQAHPNAMFVLMHIDYPYQDEAIALAKHYANAYVDMCWAWIINPVAGVRFMKECLAAAPVHKLFTFGGDYMPAELSVGHAAVARRGIARTVTELAEEGWLEDAEAPALIERVMRGNAHELYDYDRAVSHWRK